MVPGHPAVKTLAETGPRWIGQLRFLTGCELQTMAALEPSSTCCPAGTGEVRFDGATAGKVRIRPTHRKFAGQALRFHLIEDFTIIIEVTR